MGWGSGSSLMWDVIEALLPEVRDAAVRKRIYVKLIRAFDREDWDTHDDIEPGFDPAFDEAMEEVHPSRRKDKTE